MFKKKFNNFYFLCKDSLLVYKLIGILVLFLIFIFLDGFFFLVGVDIDLFFFSIEDFFVDMVLDILLLVIILIKGVGGCNIIIYIY